MKRYVRFAIALAVLAGLLFLLTIDVKIESIIQTGGILGLALTLFAETGLLIGFFLPGDTLLFAAGFYAGQGDISLPAVVIALILGAILGNMMGYEIGKRSGSKLFKQEQSLFFTHENVARTEAFFSRHGGKTIILARFIPIVRTLTPLMAGVGHMPYRRFMTYNILGALLWVPSITLVGYWAAKVLGQYFNIDHYILPILLIAMGASAFATFWHIWRDPKSRQVFKDSVRRNYNNFFKN